MTPQKFGSFIAGQRNKHHMTQSQLTEQLHVSVAAVSKWERGLCLPEVSKFEDIAGVFQLSLLELMQCREAGTADREIDTVLTDTIKLAETQHRKKTKKRILTIAALAVLCACIYFFPIYRMLQVWSPSYYTSGELSKLAYIGSREERDTGRLFLAQAEEAFSDLSTPRNQLEEKYGLLRRYATESERAGESEKHRLKLWSAHFNTNDGYGYVWVHYSNSVYGADGREICGSWDVPALWIFEKDTAGIWRLIYIKEHP